MKIESGTDILDVQSRLGLGKNEELRESKKREKYLQKFSRLITPTRPTVRMTPHIPTAMVRQGGVSLEGEDGEVKVKTTSKGSDEPQIFMTTRRFEQPETDYSRRVFDLICQEALTVHEIGHILHTDHKDFMSYLSNVEMDKKKPFKRIWNCLEDAAIEEQLRRQFVVEHELEVLNKNLTSLDNVGYVLGDGSMSLSFYQAVQLGLLDLGVYDSGLFKKLLDPDDGDVYMADPNDAELLQNFVPEMKSVVKDVVTEPESPKRNKRIYEFWKEFVKFADRAEADGMAESQLNSLLSDSGTIQQGDGDGEGQSVGENAPIEGKPDDTEGTFGQGRSATQLSRDDVAEDIETVVAIATGEASTQGREGEGGGGDDGEDGSESPRRSQGDSDLEEQFQQEIASEAAELDGGESLIEEAENFLEILNEADQDARGGRRGGGGWEGLTLDIPEGDGFEEDRWKRSKRRGKQLARLLRNLKHDQTNRPERFKRRGKVDTQSGSMIRADRGDYRIFHQMEDSPEKDYDAIFVLDRSGSMSGRQVEHAEEAMGSLAYALEEIDVNTSVLDLHRNQARLALAFGQGIEDERGVMFSGAAGGGTPLAKVLYLARKRVEGQNSHPFMVVVTDGYPHDKEEYQDQLSKCNFPVLGVYIGNPGSEDERFFDQQVTVQGGDMDNVLMSLCREIMF